MEYGSSLPDSGLLCVERNNPVMHMTLKLTFVDRATSPSTDGILR